MKWRAVTSGRHPDDLPWILDTAESDHAPAPLTVEAVKSLAAHSGTEGLIVLGDDPDLARLGALVADLELRLPIALIPNGDSDVLRMFGLTRDSVLSRLQSGSVYPVDLGQLTIGSSKSAFVGHVTAAPPLWQRAMLRDVEVVVTTSRGTSRIGSASIVVANTQYVAGRCLAPKAALTDGVVDIQSTGGSLLSRFRARRLAERGLHLRLRSVWRRSARSCEIDVPVGWQVSADGVRVGRGSFEIAVRPRAFRLWI